MSTFDYLQKKLLAVGERKSDSLILQKNIHLINLISLVLLLINSINILTLFLFRHIDWIEGGGFLMSVFAFTGVYFLNFHRYFIFSKWIVIIYPLINFILLPYINPSNDNILLWAPYVVVFHNIILLLTLDFQKEKWALYGSLLTNFSFLFLMDKVFLKVTGDKLLSELIQSDYLSYKLPQVLSWMVIVISISYKRNINDRFATKLLTATNDLNRQLSIIQEQNTKIEEQNIRINETNLRLVKMYSIMMKLSQSEHIQAGQWKDALAEISLNAYKALKVSRVSIWEYNNENKTLLCLKMYSQKEMEYSDGILLNSEEYPAYFQAVGNKEVIVASDARNHPVTKCFNKNYFIPNDIYSLLDVPFFFNGEMKGIICFEQQESVRKWMSDEVIFAKSIADLLMMAFNTYQFKQNTEIIRQQHKEIEFKNDELMAQKEEILQINEHLEEKVKARTSLLEQQNHRLSEYAFINAHLLRGPLCRIMGLVNLLGQPENSNEFGLLITLLRESTGELDSVVLKINTLLEETDTLTIEEIRAIRHSL